MEAGMEFIWIKKDNGYDLSFNSFDVKLPLRSGFRCVYMCWVQEGSDRDETVRQREV